jgi:hypothetical protein
MRQLVVVDVSGGVHNLGTMTATSPPVFAPDGTVSYTITAQLWPDPDNGAYSWPYLEDSP